MSAAVTAAESVRVVTVRIAGHHFAIDGSLTMPTDGSMCLTIRPRSIDETTYRAACLAFLDRPVTATASLYEVAEPIGRTMIMRLPIIPLIASPQEDAFEAFQRVAQELHDWLNALQNA